MKDFFDNLFLVYFPYIALTVFVAGILFYILKSNNTIQAKSTQFLSNDKGVKWGSAIFHYSILMVLVGHIFGLLVPEKVYTIVMTTETKYILAIIFGTLSGVLALIGIAMLLWRRFNNEMVRVNSTPHDFIIAALLLLQIVIGLMCTYITAHSSIENYVSLDEWAQDLVLLKPDSWLHITNVHWIYKLHIVNGFLIFMIFPYSKLMHMVATPVRYILKPNK